MWFHLAKNIYFPRNVRVGHLDPGEVIHMWIWYAKTYQSPLQDFCECVENFWINNPWLLTLNTLIYRPGLSMHQKVWRLFCFGFPIITRAYRRLIWWVGNSLISLLKLDKASRKISIYDWQREICTHNQLKYYWG